MAVEPPCQQLYHDLNRKQCLCHLDEACISPQLDLSPYEGHVSGDNATSRSHSEETAKWREDILLKLGLITSVAEADFCARLREVQRILMEKGILEQLSLLVCCPDQAVAFSASNCLKAFCVAYTNETLVQGFLHQANNAIRNPQHESDLSTSCAVNKVVFTFDLLAGLLETPVESASSGIQGAGTYKLPCLAASNVVEDRGEGTSGLQSKPAPDLAELCCSASQANVLEFCTVFATHLGADAHHIGDDTWSKAFLLWLQSLDNHPSRKVSFAYFRLLYSLTKYLFSHGQPVDFLSHAHSIVPLLVALLKSHCHVNVNVLKSVLDTLCLCIRYCNRETMFLLQDPSPNVTKVKGELWAALQGVLSVVVQTAWLDNVPYHEGPVGFGGTKFMRAGEKISRFDGYVTGDRTLLRKLINLVIQCLDHVSYLSRHSSTVHLSSLKQMSSFVVSKLKVTSAFQNQTMHPEEWIFTLFGDQDDALIATMLSLLKISMAHKRLGEKSNAHTAGTSTEYQDELGISSGDEKLACGSCESVEGERRDCVLNPHHIFVSFLHHMTWDHSILLDHLISTETDFLEYLVRYLRCVTCEWAEFVRAHQDHGTQSEQCPEKGRSHKSYLDCSDHHANYQEAVVEERGSNSSRDDSFCNDNSYDTDNSHNDGDSGCDYVDGTGDADACEETGNFAAESVDGNSTKTTSSCCSSYHHKRRYCGTGEQSEENQTKHFKISPRENIDDVHKIMASNERGTVAEKCSISERDETESLPNEKQIHSQLNSVNYSSPDDEICSVSDLDDKKCSSDLLDDTMTVLIRLRLAIERLHKKNLFPFSAKPLLKLLMNVEDLYEK